MATKVLMEALSPTMTEGRVIKWLKKEGDPVKNGETLAEVETDKAVMELTARGDGVLRKIVAPEGATVEVSNLVAVIASANEDISAIAGNEPAPKAPPAKTTEDRRPKPEAATAAPSRPPAPAPA